MTSPIVKWAGGKSWAIPVLGPRIEAKLVQTGGRYIEPFVGGAAMALWLEHPHMILSDACAGLMNLYTVLRDGHVQELRSVLDDAGKHIDEDSYYLIRELIRDDVTPPECLIEHAAWFIYLNKTCYNGLHRENKSGEFNSPFGYPRVCDGRLFPMLYQLQDVADVLQGADLFTADFGHVIRAAGSGDLLYIDPPYDGGYVSYVASGFTEADQTRLATELYYATQRGAAVVAHNARTPLIEYLYNEWAHLEPTGERRAINSDGAGRGDAPCVIITAGMS